MSIEAARKKLEFIEANPEIFDERLVLDKGKVLLVDYMGDDTRIVDAARVSYGGGTTTVRRDKGLIDYLVRHRHSSPLEQVSFTFRMKLPLFVFAQIVRHRTAKINSLSGRYSVLEEEFYMPTEFRKQDSVNKQGSSDEVLFSQALNYVLESQVKDTYQNYSHMLSNGISREMARIYLPQSLYTEVYWKIDLRNLLHFLDLRLDSHAQHEVQVYAQAMFDIISPIVPYTIESWERHVQKAITLNEADQQVLRAILEGGEIDSLGLSKGLLREAKEKMTKLIGWTEPVAEEEDEVVS